MQDEIFIISTNSFQVPDATANLLGLPESKGFRYSFGDNPFPLLGIDHSGECHIIDDATSIADYPDAPIWVIPDSHPLEDEFKIYLQRYFSQNTVQQLYLMLHDGEGSYHYEHEKGACKAAGKQVDKIMAYRGHHTMGHPIGDGLEKVAQCVCTDDPPSLSEDLHVALDHFRRAPSYSPFQRATIRVHNKIYAMHHTYDSSPESRYDLQEAIRSLNDDEDFKIAALKIDDLAHVNDAATFQQVAPPVLKQLKDCFS